MNNHSNKKAGLEPFFIIELSCERRVYKTRLSLLYKKIQLALTSGKNSTKSIEDFRRTTANLFRKEI